VKASRFRIAWLMVVIAVAALDFTAMRAFLRLPDIRFFLPRPKVHREPLKIEVESVNGKALAALAELVEPELAHFRHRVVQRARQPVECWVRTGPARNILSVSGVQLVAWLADVPFGVLAPVSGDEQWHLYNNSTNPFL
jgi:hypothetical protein